MADESASVIVTEVNTSNSKENDDDTVGMDNSENSSETITTVIGRTDNIEPPSNVGDETNSASESDAVEIARIEAERDVAIAALDAETEQARDETHRTALEIEAEKRNGLEECREEIENLKMRIAAMEESQSSLIQPPQQEIAEEMVEAIAETLETPLETPSTPLSTSTPTIETQMEVSVENEEGEQAHAEAKARRKYVAI